MAKRVLLVEPDRIVASIYQEVLSTHFDVSWARTAQGAISALDKKRYDLVISETSLDHHNGVELLSEIRSYEDWNSLPIIFLSAIPKERFPLNIRQWQKLGVKAYLNKSLTRPSSLRHAALDALL